MMHRHDYPRCGNERKHASLSLLYTILIYILMAFLNVKKMQNFSTNQHFLRSILKNNFDLNKKSFSVVKVLPPKMQNLRTLIKRRCREF